MTEVEPVKTVTLNDTQYNVDDMSERGQYIVAQLGEIQQESQEMKFKLDRLEIARKGFVELLQAEVEDQPAEAESRVEVKERGLLQPPFLCLTKSLLRLSSMY